MSLNEKPLVSVIVPFMNEERFLDETIQSVINQTYPHWELLLVDDGSTNRSTDIAKRYVDLYPERIFYYDHANHENKGVCITRNLGVEKAKGELIAFLDADDLFLPNKLRDQVDYFSNYPEIGMVTEASYYWFKWADENSNDRIIKVGGENDKVINPPQLMYDLYPLKNGDAPCPCSIMVRKEVIQKVGGFEPDFKNEYQLYEDQAFLVKIYLSEKVYISSKPNNMYRQRPDSVVYKVHGSGDYHKVREYFLNWLKNYLNQNQLTDKKTLSLLNKALLPYRHPIYNKFFKILPKNLINYTKIKLNLLRHKLLKKLPVLNVYFV